MLIFRRKRAITGLFSALLLTLQLLAGALCIATPALHAEPMAAHTADHVSAAIGDHCDAAAMSQSEHNTHNACTHCSMPEDLLNAFAADIDAGEPLLQVMTVDMRVAVTSDPLSQALPTGPPDRSQPLYLSTQRIRI